MQPKKEKLNKSLKPWEDNATQKRKTEKYRNKIKIKELILGVVGENFFKQIFKYVILCN